MLAGIICESMMKSLEGWWHLGVGLGEYDSFETRV